MDGQQLDMARDVAILALETAALQCRLTLPVQNLFETRTLAPGPFQVSIVSSRNGKAR
jgi:hypothetical protein